jgi:hypothetical protein
MTALPRPRIAVYSSGAKDGVGGRICAGALLHVGQVLYWLSDSHENSFPLLSCRTLPTPGSGDGRMESSQGNAPCNKTFCRRVRSLARSLDGLNWSLRSDLHRRLPRYEGGPVAAEARRLSICKVQNEECRTRVSSRMRFCIIHSSILHLEWCSRLGSRQRPHPPEGCALYTELREPRIWCGYRNSHPD